MKNKRAKLVIILSSLFVLCLFVTAIAQTFVLKKLQKQNYEQELLLQDLYEKDQQADREKEYYESDEYLEEYFRTHGNQKEGDIVYTE